MPIQSVCRTEYARASIFRHYGSRLSCGLQPFVACPVSAALEVVSFSSSAARDRDDNLL